jgi:uncharacterized protein (TIGR02596 family)
MTMKTRLPSEKKQSAFSLIELLVVIAIIGIIGTFAVPAVGNLLKGSAMTQAANLISDNTASARQYALTKNRTVEVRFYSFADPELPGESIKDQSTWRFRALQYFEIGEGGVPNPVGKVARFPDTVIMNSDSTLSSIFGVLTPTTPKSNNNDPELPRGVKLDYRYVSFRFQPDGSTSLSQDGPTTAGANNQWYITVHLLNDLPKATAGKPPPNFFTWMIDPVSGSTKLLRPGAK